MLAWLQSEIIIENVLRAYNNTAPIFSRYAVRISSHCAPRFCPEDTLTARFRTSGALRTLIKLLSFIFSFVVFVLLPL